MKRWWRGTEPWRGREAVEMQHALAVEERLAHVRVVLAMVSLGVAGAERARPNGTLVVLIFAALAIYAVVLLAGIRARRVRTNRQVATAHAVDTAWILLVLGLTGGALSPFSLLFLFAILAAGYRWGLIETWMTCGVGIAALGLHGLIANTWLGGPPPDGHLVFMRLTYVAIAGLLVGYTAETERMHRYRAWSVSRILSRVRSEGGLVAAVQAVLDELMAQAQASHAVLALEEEGRDAVFLWQAERTRESHRVSVRLTQHSRDAVGTYLFPVPHAASAWCAARPAASAGEVKVQALGPSGARVSVATDVAPLVGTPFEWQTAFCLSNVAGEGWQGRLFLFVPGPTRAALPLLRHLQIVVGQVAPAMFNLYLQRRLQSRTGVVERARISRELHDGVIQSLIGLEMQLEVLRREGNGRIPGSMATQLASIQKILGQEILNVRDLMQLLKPVEVDAHRLVEHLAETVERFRHRTGIDARFACEVDEIDLTPRVCRELAGVVQEALANVRKHSGATSVVVRLQPCGDEWQLAIDDNGRGFGFEGYLTHEQVEAQRRGPSIIKERVRAIGGRLGIHSQPGFGTRLEITLPGRHHA
jgi:signal transduction histidine kinase